MEPESSPPPPPPQLPLHSEALTQRMKEDTCFRCKNKGHWAQSCPLGSPSGSSPPPQQLSNSEALTQRMKEDTCFRCKNKGHWAQNCPLGSPSGSPSKAKLSDVPVMHCKCDATCKVSTSETPKNPRRKFYRCPGNSPDVACGGFVEWCDKFTAQQCPCGAGPCRIYVRKGNDKKCFYLGCRIKKGFGACNFSQKVGEERLVTTPPQAWRMEIEPPAMDNPDYSVDHADVNQDQELEELVQCGSKKLDKMLFNLSAPELNNRRDLQEMVMKDNGSGATSHDSIIKDSAMEDIALSDHISPIKIDTPCLMPQESEIRSWQDDFMKQIFAVGDGLTQETLKLILGLQVMRWCGHISLQLSQRISEPMPKPFFCCIFPSLSTMMKVVNVEVIIKRSQSLFPHIPSGPPLNDRLSDSFLPKTNDEQLQFLDRLSDLLNGGNSNWPSNSVTGGKYTEMLQRIAADVQNEFIALLDRIDPLNLELLENEAVVCFKTLCLLRTVDCGGFSRSVMHYIRCASSLTEIEVSHGCDPSLQLQELKSRLSAELKHYESASQHHSEKLNAYGASQGRLQVLSQNAARFREMLSQIEGEIAQCQAESLELERCLVEVNQEVKKSRESLEAVTREVKEVEDKEMKRAAAKDALEKARSGLRQ